MIRYESKFLNEVQRAYNKTKLELCNDARQEMKRDILQCAEQGWQSIEIDVAEYIIETDNAVLKDAAKYAMEYFGLLGFTIRSINEYVFEVSWA